MEGVKLAAAYAFMPNFIGYCGKSTFYTALKSGDLQLLHSELKKIVALNGYLNVIASCNSKKPFDRDVVEAFWIGNSLLEKVERKDIAEMFMGFYKKGAISRERAEKLASSIPEGAVPHHSFHVLYVNSLSGVLKDDVQKLDMCRVGWGEVLETKGDKANVLYMPICGKRGSYRLGEKRERQIITSLEGYSSVGELREGDTVTFHWDFAVQKISRENEKILERYTLRNIDAVNR